MIGKEEFEELIEDYQKNEEYIDNLADILKIDIFESPICNYTYELFNKVLKSNFTKEGVDWIYWFLFDKPEGEEPKAWDEKEEPIPTKTISDLWNIVKEYRI